MEQKGQVLQHTKAASIECQRFSANNANNHRKSRQIIIIL